MDLQVQEQCFQQNGEKMQEIMEVQEEVDHLEIQEQLVEQVIQ